MRHQMGDDIEPTPAWIRWGLGIAAFLAVLKLLGVI